MYSDISVAWKKKIARIDHKKYTKQILFPTLNEREKPSRFPGARALQKPIAPTKARKLREKRLPYKDTKPDQTPPKERQ
jgi:hypothetical protein